MTSYLLELDKVINITYNRNISSSVRVANTELYFIFILFRIRIEHNIICHRMVIYFTVTITRSYDIEKIIEDSRTDNII